MNEQPMPPVSHREDMASMVGEILDPFNVWVTGIAVGHSPTHNECAQHYMTHGGLERFRQLHPTFIVDPLPVAA